MQLHKNLSFSDVFCISAGVMISSGIFILPGIAFKQTGPAVFISYILAGIIALGGIMSVIELATAMPKAGGDYYFVTRSMGPLIGTVNGFLSWSAIALKSAFAVFGMASVIKGFVPDIEIFSCSVIITLLFAALNIVGVKAAARFEVTLVLMLLAVMLAFVFFGLPQVSVQKFEPFVFHGGGTIVQTAATVFISFGGLLTVATVSEEIKQPRKNIPRGMISSVVIITLLYAVTLIVIVGVMDPAKLSGSITPVADAAAIIGGPPGYWIVTTGSFLAFLTTANAGIMSASRYPLALSRDSLIPRYLATVNKKFNTPVYSILLTSGLIILALTMPLEMLVSAASTVILTSHILSNLAVIILRESKVQNYQPSFKSPFYPWLHLAGIVVFALMIYDMGSRAVIISTAGILLSLICYFTYGRKANREYALLHIIERLTNRKMTSHCLEKELKEIIHSRDEIIKDDIDAILETAPVFELDRHLQAETVFKKLAPKLHKIVDIPEKRLIELFLEREKQSSTVLSNFVAIPHIIADAENLFKIIIVRNTGGIEFDAQNNDIHALFIIIGSLDCRNLHLRALAALAQIIQNSNFEQQWLTARTADQLRDILLVSTRRRDKN